MLVTVLSYATAIGQAVNFYLLARGKIRATLWLSLFVMAGYGYIEGTLRLWPFVALDAFIFSQAAIGLAKGIGQNAKNSQGTQALERNRRGGGVALRAAPRPNVAGEDDPEGTLH